MLYPTIDVHTSDFYAKSHFFPLFFMCFTNLPHVCRRNEIQLSMICKTVKISLQILLNEQKCGAHDHKGQVVFLNEPMPLK